MGLVCNVFYISHKCTKKFNQPIIKHLSFIFLLIMILNIEIRQIKNFANIKINLAYNLKKG